MPTSSGNPTFSVIPPDSSKKQKKKRVRVFTASDRATHRTIEKQRREALNQKFLELARILPPLASVRRLSKAVIVKESVSYLQELRAARLAATKEVRGLLAERNTLVDEVNYWRTQQCGPQAEIYQVAPISKGISGLFDVEKEEFGSFPGGFGDNSDEQDEDHNATREDGEYSSFPGDTNPSDGGNGEQSQNVTDNTSPNSQSSLATGNTQPATERVGDNPCRDFLQPAGDTSLPISNPVQMGPVIGFAPSLEGLDSLPDAPPAGYNDLAPNSSTVSGDIGTFPMTSVNTESPGYPNDLLAFLDGVETDLDHPSGNLDTYGEYPLPFIPIASPPDYNRRGSGIVPQTFPAYVDEINFGQNP